VNSTLTHRDVLMPQSPGGLGKGTVLALIVHIGLVIALAFGVSWRAQEPAGFSAELWAAVPQVAAPPAVEPVPAPRPPAPVVKPAEPAPRSAQVDAQIAIEKAERERKERERNERERLEREKAEKLAAEKRERELEAKRQKAEEERTAKQREENLKRMMGQVDGTGAPNSTGTAARDAAPSASYAGRIRARVKPNIVLTDEVAGNPSAEVEVRCAADGTIVGRRLVKSSGSREWDEAVLRAIDRTEILPRDVDGRVPGTVVIAFRPRE
jgi:colicin import membrane protein